MPLITTVPRRTLDAPGTEFQIRVAADGVRAVLLCMCGAILADETRHGADPDEQELDHGHALAESLGWHLRRFLCGRCGAHWEARERKGVTG